MNSPAPDGRSVGRSAGEARALADEYARLLASAVTTLGERVRDARLPLHILLSSPFGDLNENQEEMLGAAQSALESADAELQMLARLVELDRGLASRRPRCIGVAALVQPAIVIARSRAEAIGSIARLAEYVPDTLPRVVVDPVHVQEAIAALLSDAMGRAGSGEESGAEFSVTAREQTPETIALTVMPHRAASEESLPVLLALRLIRQEGGSVVDGERVRTILLPAEPTSVTDAPATPAPPRRRRP